jgi:hypothetical protein
VQTSDTGQVNWTTVTKPGVANTVGGYEIWRFADSLQAANPIFIKLEYGVSSVASVPSLWVQLGVAMNGSGSFVGVTSTRVQAGMGNAGTTTPHDCLFTGDTDRLGLYLHYKDNAASGNVQRALMVSVERELDASGARVGTGAYVTVCSANGGMQSQARQEYFSRSAGGVGVETDLGALVPDIGSGSAGSDVSMFPQYLAHNSFKPFGLNHFIYFHPAISAYTQVQFTVYGQTRTYFCLGSFFAQGTVHRGGTTLANDTTLMARYEN